MVGLALLDEDPVDVARVDQHEEAVPAEGQPQRPAHRVEEREDQRRAARGDREQPGQAQAWGQGAPMSSSSWFGLGLSLGLGIGIGLGLG